MFRNRRGGRDIITRRSKGKLERQASKWRGAKEARLRFEGKKGEGIDSCRYGRAEKNADYQDQPDASGPSIKIGPLLERLQDESRRSG